MNERRKYIPLQDRVPSGVIPFRERTSLTKEEKARLFTVDDLIQPPTATLQDSIWARPDNQRQTIKQTVKSSPIVNKEIMIPSGVTFEPKTPMAVTSGLQMGHSSGLEASRWTSPPHKFALNKQNGQLNHSDAPVISDHSQISPHLRSDLTNLNLDIQAKAQHGLQTLGSEPTSHATDQLGDSVLVSKDMKGVEAKSAVEHTPDNEDAFLAFLKKKAAANAEAMKKADELRSEAERVQATEPQNSAPMSQTQQLSFPTRSKFVPNKESDDQFQAFLNAKKNAEVKNGKRYNLAGAQKPPQATSIAQLAETLIDHPNSNQKEHVSLFHKVDPHAIFSPRDLDPKLAPGPVVISENETCQNPGISGGWEVKGLLTDPRELHKRLLADLREQENIVPSDLRLTIEALGETTGLIPRNSVNSFEEKISDAGIEQNHKEIVRANQGKDPKESLLDWDGKTWLPAPVDRRSDGGGFDNSFMSKYIREEWEPRAPHGPSVTVDIDCPEFKFGTAPVTNMSLDGRVVQPDTIPDIENSENELKRLNQTADISVTLMTKRLEKKSKTSRRWAEAHAAHNLAAVSKNTETNPYAPVVECYLRPATGTDLRGICEIYNHYVQNKNSIITEDQSAVTEEDVSYLIEHSKDEKLPIIVAVRGRMPSPMSQGQSRLSQPNKVTLPQFEGIIGFGFAESFNYGFTTLRTGRSRATVNLQFYVHPEYTRKGVGRSLLDRLIQCMSHSYGARDGYDWMNPGDDKVYQVGGTQYWHQLVIQLAVMKKDDPNYEFMKGFLRRYHFSEEGRLCSIIRSSTNGGSAKFADIVFFLKEAAQKTEFPPFI